MYKVKLLLVLLLVSTNKLAAVETQGIMPFRSGSYQQMLDRHADKAYVLVVWSISCASCIKEMAMLKEVHQEQPELKLVMLAIDDISEQDEINSLLAKQGIADLESWAFADDDVQGLRYQIDPTWYGEIPRIYFFDEQHKRQGFSGAMTKQEFLGAINNCVANISAALVFVVSNVGYRGCGEDSEKSR